MNRRAFAARPVRLGAWLALAATALLPPTAAHAGGRADYVRDAFEEQVDALVRDGYERPAQAVSALGQMQESSRTPNQTRQLLQAIGSIEARAGNHAKAGAAAEQLLTLSVDRHDDLALASSNLVRAQLAENAGQLDVAAALAQTALPTFQAGCQATEPRAKQVAGVHCDYRATWRVLHILESRAMSLGVPVTQVAHLEAALALAEWAGDARRQSTDLGSLALLAQGRGDTEAAQRLMMQAKRQVSQVNDIGLQAVMSDIEARLAALRDDRLQSLHCHEEARYYASLANAPRLEARMLTNLSDAYGRLGRPADALRAAEQALVIVRRHNDLRTERVLINNAGIAKIGLGRIAEGKQDLARLLELWQQGGETGRQAETLKEFGEALASAGDARSAIELFHREQAVSAELMKRNRELALKELQTRNAAEARQRDIDLLARDNALKTAALANRALLQRIWWLLAALMVVATVLVALLYRRMRLTHRQLAASHRQLQSQSERDPLTNLANRRHFQSVMASLVSHGGFEGALLLVDIDHFKRVNDQQGHAAGDEVLMEVARRLNQAVRDDDLVVRWGGEEFLVLAPSAAPEQAEQIAHRILRMLSQTPIVFDHRRLFITASIGYGRFPLAPHGATVTWEQALNLADMALYTAKNQGRNRAVGITSTTAPTPQALREIETDFDRAWQEGRVQLRQTPGPHADDRLCTTA